MVPDIATILTQGHDTMKKILSAAALAMTTTAAFADPGAFLEITLKIDASNRAAAGAIYSEYKQPFLTTIEGAEQKTLLIRAEDVQVLHGFDTVEHAQAYLKSDLFNKDIVAKLAPLLAVEPEIRIYETK